MNNSAKTSYFRSYEQLGAISYVRMFIAANSHVWTFASMSFRSYEQITKNVVFSLLCTFAHMNFRSYEQFYQNFLFSQVWTFASMHFRTYELSHLCTFESMNFRTYALSRVWTFALMHFRTYELIGILGQHDKRINYYD